MMLVFETRAEARVYLRVLGMRWHRDGAFSDQDREYWWYGDGTDALLDHSATITGIDGRYHVAVYERKTQA